VPLNKPLQSNCTALLAGMEADSARFSRQAVESPDDLSLWTKLFTVSQIMLSAIREDKVPSALEEICSNLLGCERLAIVEISHGTGLVQFRRAPQVSSEMRLALADQGRFLESQIQPGDIRYISDEIDDNAAKLSQLRIHALVPLWLDRESSGALLLFELLPQRSGFDTEDREVLRLLSTNAGPCLRSKLRG